MPSEDPSSVLAAVFLAGFVEERAAGELAGRSDAALRVLATAAALFHQRGAAATSVRDLTKACGLTPGALYNHFGSRDDLLYTLVRHGHDGMGRRLDAHVRDGDPPRAAFAGFVRGYVLGHLLRPELAQVVRREYLHLTPARHEEIVTARRDVRRRLGAILAAGAETGEFDLIDGSATGQAVMIMDMCSRTSEWYHRTGALEAEVLAERYVAAAQRLVTRA